MYPIYYVNLTGHITTGTSKKINIVEVKGIVIKGNENRPAIKKRFLRDHFKNNKKVQAFDLKRLTIVKVKIIKKLGYGIE